MPDIDSRLQVRVEAKLTALEKQMAQALKLVSASTSNIQGNLDQMNSRIAKSAQASGQAIERALSKVEAGYRSVITSVDPVTASTQRLAQQEEQLVAAQKHGIISLEEKNRVLDMARQQHARLAASMDPAVRKLEEQAQAGVRASQAYQNLIASLNPAAAAAQRLARGQQVLSNALEAGTIDVSQHGQALRLLQLEYTRSMQAIRNGATAATAATGGFLSANRAGRFVLQNTAAQLGDIAIQLEMGTSPARVMAQQLPQLFSGFSALRGVLGVVGPILGTFAAIGIPVAAMLMSLGNDAEDTGDKVQSFTDKLSAAEAALGRAEAAMARAADGGLEDLAKRYGEVTQAVRDLAEELANIELKGAKVAVGAVIDDALGENFTAQIDRVFGAVGAAIVDSTAESIAEQKRLIEELATSIENRQRAGTIVSPEEVSLLKQMREELAGAERDFANLGELAGKISIDPELLLQINAAQEAARSALQAGDFVGVADAVAEIRALLRASGAELDEGVIEGLVAAEDEARAMAKQLGDAVVITEDLAEAAMHIAGPIHAAASAASQLARELNVSLATASRLLALQGSKRNSVILDPRDPNYDPIAAEMVRVREEAGSVSPFDASRQKSSSSRSRRGGGGGGGAKSKATPADVLETAAREIETMQRRIEMIGKSDAEIAGLTARYRALDEAKRKGIDVDKTLAGTGRTLRDEIMAQAEAVRQVAEEYDQAKVSQEFFEASIDSISGAMADALTGAEDFRDAIAGVFRGIAQDILQAGIKKAILSVFPSDGPAKSGGRIFGILGSIFSASGGGYTGNGPRSGGIDGEGGFVGILHPKETVIDHTKGQRFGGTTEVRVAGGDLTIGDNGELMARVQVIADNRIRQAQPALTQAALSTARQSKRYLR